MDKRLIDEIFSNTRCIFCVSAVDTYEGDHGYTSRREGYTCKIKKGSFVEGLTKNCTESDSFRCPLFIEGKEMIKLKFLNEVINDC